MRSSRAGDRRHKAQSGSRGAPLELTIQELAHGGDGVAIVLANGERRAVFVRGGAPGDVVRANVDFASRPARANILEW